MTHYGPCAIFFNKDTFYPNVDVKSIYLHHTRRDLLDDVMEGDLEWLLQGVLSRALLRRSTVSGQKYFAVLSLHLCNIHARKEGIAKKFILTLRAVMISQEVDLVAGDQATCLVPHLLGVPHKKLPAAQVQIQISVSTQCSFQNTRKRQ